MAPRAKTDCEKCSGAVMCVIAVPLLGVAAIFYAVTWPIHGGIPLLLNKIKKKKSKVVKTKTTV